MGIKKKIKSAVHAVMMMSKEEIVKPIIIPTDRERLLEGKVALITGGSSGIGLAVAKAFRDSGANVVIAGTNEEHLKNALSKLNTGRSGGGIYGGDRYAKGIIIDVREVETLPDKVKDAAALFEENRIDILVNSAGLVSRQDFWDTDEDGYDAIMDTNARGTFFMSRAVANMMIEKKIRGHILNVTSSSALRPAWTPYQISKWAVKGLTLGLADLMIPHGIVVNAIAPGPTATPMLGKKEGDSIFEPHTPSGRFSMPEEIASLAVFMVSGAGDMIVGDTVYMTGGSGTLTLHH